jgi:hypothetical protein
MKQVKEIQGKNCDSFVKITKYDHICVTNVKNGGMGCAIKRQRIANL